MTRSANHGRSDINGLLHEVQRPTRNQSPQAPKQITLKNGRPATEGSCQVCGTKIFKIGAAK